MSKEKDTRAGGPTGSKKAAGPVLASDVTLAETSARGCRFPTKKNREDQHLFCNKPSVPGKSFCQEHCDIVYINEAEKSK